MNVGFPYTSDVDIQYTLYDYHAFPDNKIQNEINYLKSRIFQMQDELDRRHLKNDNGFWGESMRRFICDIKGIKP